jgi:EmrB/QacA subfamily drug resistance transporter
MAAQVEMPVQLRHSAWLALVTVSLGYFMNVLDSTVVNVAIPAIISGLHTTADQVLWVISGYLLPYAMLLLVAGRLGDLLGHRAVFFVGLAIFTTASVLCGLAQSPGELIAARVLEGVGAAAASPQAVAITSVIFPPERRGTAFGVLAGVVGVASVAGPALGGVVTNYLGWRWIFFLNVPVGVAALIGTFWFIPATLTSARQRLRPVTVLLATAGLFTVLFALLEGQRYGWGVIAGPVSIPALLVLGPVLLTIAVLRERNGVESLLPRALFTSRNYAVAVGAAAALSFGIFASQLVMTIYLELHVRLNPFHAGLAQVPMWLAATLVSPVGGRVSDRIGRRPVLILAFSTFAAGDALAAASAGAGLPWAAFIGALVIAGLGAGFIFGPMPAVAMAEVPPRMAGGASAMIETSRQVGGAVATAVVGAVLGSLARPTATSVVSLLITADLLAVAAAGCCFLRRGAPDSAGPR